MATALHRLTAQQVKKAASSASLSERGGLSLRTTTAGTIAGSSATHSRANSSTKVREATWSEIYWTMRLWLVPVERRKTRRDVTRRAHTEAHVEMVRTPHKLVLAEPG